MKTHTGPERSTQRTDRSEPGAADTDHWLRVSRWGAAAMGAWSLGLQLLIGEVVPPVLVIGLIFVSFVPFLRAGARRLGLVVGVLAVLAIVGNLAPLVDELTHPDSGWAFVPSLFALLNAVVLTVAGVAAFRRSAASPGPLLVGSATVLVVGVLSAMVATTSVESDDRVAGDTVIVATGNEFVDERVVVPAGTNGFWLDNRDGIRHTFTTRDVDFEIDAPGESQQRGELDLEVGVYEVHCAVPGHGNMKLELVVEG